MSYLLDKKIKRKKFFKIALGVFIFIIIFYFRFGVFNGLSYISEKIFHPVFAVGNNIGEVFGSVGSYFSSKNSLYIQNQNLQLQVKENDARMANYDSVLAENVSFKEILGRKDEKIPMILASILSKANQSVYDTLVVDVGVKDGIKIGDVVFAFGNVPIGRVDFAYEDSSKIVLFSNSGERTQAIVSINNQSVDGVVSGVGKDIFLEVVGRGGGNFEMILPRELELKKGDKVVMPGINPYVLAEVVTIISDPRDPFTKALLVSPVNIRELKFVQVEI